MMEVAELEYRKMRRSGMELQMAPMIDCVFLLLIFFMVSAIMKIPPRFEVELPESLTRHEFPQKRFNLFIGRNGEMAVDDQMMLDYDDLEDYLARHEKRIETLIIKADRYAEHGWVIDAMERAKRREIEELAIAIKGKGKGIKLE
jgi:biopolymer transport protein ExbD